MESTNALLVALQELTFTRTEQIRLHGDGTDVSALDTAIAEKVDALPDNVRAVYTRLSSKDTIVVSPMHANRCAVCGADLATSIVQKVMLGEEVANCPSCARFLCKQEGAKWIKKRDPRAVRAQACGIERFSSESLMVCDLKSDTKEGAVRELAERLVAAGIVDAADALVASAMERENIVSTNLGTGLAFPHVRGIEGGALTVAFGVSRAGIKWNDGEDPVHLVFFSTIPTVASTFYLKVISGLVQSYGKQDKRDIAMRASTDAQLWSRLKTATKLTIK